MLPVSSGPIREGEVLVGSDGRISEVGPSGAAPLPEGTVARELGDAILLPGLVNVHAHPELTMFRGALEDLPFEEWILRLVTTKRARLTDEDHAAAAMWAVAESLAAGVTTIAATEASGAAAGAMAAAGIRGIVYQEAFGPDPAPKAVSASMRTLEADLERTRGLAMAGSRSSGSAIEERSRIIVGVSPHAPYTVSDPLYREVARLALTDGLPVAAHIAESAAERALVTSGRGAFAPGLRARGIATRTRARSPIALMERLGVLDAHPLLIHAVDIDDVDIGTIAASGCAVAHCPIANARLGHGVAPILALRASGVTVGLGTDSVGSNNRLDLLEEARFAAVLQRATSRRYDVLASPDLLRLATIEGARALGLDDQIGTLEPGKEADLCAVSIGAPHTLPVHDPVATLFHAARGTDVVLTVVGGEVLYEEETHRTVDVAAARMAVLAAGRRTAGGAGGRMENGGA